MARIRSRLIIRLLDICICVCMCVCGRPYFFFHLDTPLNCWLNRVSINTLLFHFEFNMCPSHFYFYLLVDPFISCIHCLVRLKYHLIYLQWSQPCQFQFTTIPFQSLNMLFEQTRLSSTIASLKLLLPNFNKLISTTYLKFQRNQRVTNLEIFSNYIYGYLNSM